MVLVLLYRLACKYKMNKYITNIIALLVLLFFSVKTIGQNNKPTKRYYISKDSDLFYLKQTIEKEQKCKVYFSKVIKNKGNELISFELLIELNSTNTKYSTISDSPISTTIIEFGKLGINIWDTREVEMTLPPPAY